MKLTTGGFCSLAVVFALCLASFRLGENTGWRRGTHAEYAPGSIAYAYWHDDQSRDQRALDRLQDHLNDMERLYHRAVGWNGSDKASDHPGFRDTVGAFAAHKQEAERAARKLARIND